MFGDVNTERFNYLFVDPEATLGALRATPEEWEYDGESLDGAGFRAHFSRTDGSGEEIVVEESDPAMRWREVAYVRLSGLREVAYWGEGYGGGDGLMQHIERAVGDRMLFRASEISRICERLRSDGQTNVADALERRAVEYPDAVIKISW